MIRKHENSLGLPAEVGLFLEERCPQPTGSLWKGERETSWPSEQYQVLGRLGGRREPWLIAGRCINGPAILEAVRWYLLKFSLCGSTLCSGNPRDCWVYILGMSLQFVRAVVYENVGCSHAGRASVGSDLCVH